MIHFHDYEVIRVEKGRLNSLFFGGYRDATQLKMKCKKCNKVIEKVVSGDWELEDFLN